jgi:hypothetical protein
LPPPGFDPLRMAAGAYLAPFKGQSRAHTESDLRVYLRWCLEGGLDPFAARVLCDAGAALDRPRAVRELFGEAQHRPVALDIGAIPTTTQGGLVAGHHLDRGRTLVGVHPDDHSSHNVLPCSIR